MLAFHVDRLARDSDRHSYQTASFGRDSHWVLVGVRLLLRVIWGGFSLCYCFLIVLTLVLIGFGTLDSDMHRLQRDWRHMFAHGLSKSCSCEPSQKAPGMPPRIRTNLGSKKPG